MSVSTLDESRQYPPSEGISAQIKHCIRIGDSITLQKILMAIKQNWRPEQNTKEAYLYYRKRILTGCGRISQIALDEGVPYEKVQTLTDHYFNLADSARDLESLDEIVNDMLYDFTRVIKYHAYPRYSAKVRKILAYIRQNSKSKITLQMIANAAELTPNYATALFKKETGKLIKDEIKMIRVEKAKTLLTTTFMPIGEIAVLSGFIRGNHFAKTFKQCTGISPTEYRNSAAEDQRDTLL